MLVLSRKPNQSIHIGDDIVVVVLDVRGNRVCLGIEAPANVGIRRGELEPQSNVAAPIDHLPETRTPAFSRT